MEKAKEDVLTIRDRLNYPYLVAMQILTIQKTQLESKDTAAGKLATKKAILGLLNIVPSHWKEYDKKFMKAYKESEMKEKKDLRPLVAGNTRLSVKACEALGIPTFKEIDTFDFNKLLQALTDLLDRKRMMARRDLIQELERIEFETTETKTNR